jgi:hypothetical protein
MKLRISTVRVIIIYFFLGLVTGLLFYGIPGYIWPPTEMHYFIMAVWLISTISYLIASLTSNYYLIQKDGLLHHRFNKEMFYAFKDILFIDEDYSKRYKTIRFITSMGHVRYLPFDKSGQIYSAFLEKCPNLLTREELKTRFPTLH